MFTLIAAAAVASAPAGITYLDCNALQRGEPVHYAITLNEPASLVVWSGPTATRQDRARFAADAVYFQTFRIDRVKLSMIRQYANVMGDGIETETGQCKIASAADRAF
jgi:hypothetical protein